MKTSQEKQILMIWVDFTFERSTKIFTKQNSCTNIFKWFGKYNNSNYSRNINKQNGNFLIINFNIR